MARTRFFIVLALAFGFSACSGSPTGPSVPPDTPPYGTIVFVYDRVAANVTVCGSEGVFNSRCRLAPYFRAFWPDGPKAVETFPLGDNKFQVEIKGVPTTPPPARLAVGILDYWLCPPTTICVIDYIGRGITANGVRLKDGSDRAYFSFVPPVVYP
jgi:hypothetical protein